MKTEIIKIDASSIIFESKPSVDSDDNVDAVLRYLENPICISASFESLAPAIQCLEESLPIAVPTETVYGLAACATDPIGTEKIYQIKNRPSDNPLIVHISSLDMIRTYTQNPIPSIYHPLISQFWPGPLTIILHMGSMDDKTIAVRFPAHPIMRALIHLLQVPIVAPSANLSGKPSPTLAHHVFADLKGRIKLILDGSQCQLGLESTVVNGMVYPPVILRPGSITLESIRKIRGFELTIVHSSQVVGVPSSPGMKYRHYSPSAKVILFDMCFSLAHKRIQEFIAGGEGCKFGWISTTLQSPVVQSRGNLTEYQIKVNSDNDGEAVGRELFKAFRYLDEECGVDKILMAALVDEEQGRAVMDRVRKAASQIITE